MMLGQLDHTRGPRCEAIGIALIAVDSAMQVNLMPQRKVALALEVVAPQLKWNHQFEFAAYYVSPTATIEPPMIGI